MALEIYACSIAEEDVASCVSVAVSCVLAARAAEEFGTTQLLVELAALATSLGRVRLVHDQHLRARTLRPPQQALLKSVVRPRQHHTRRL